MNLGLEASAIVVRLRATATNTNMRELALLCREIAGVALKPVADFFLMVLLVEVLPEVDGELHDILEVLHTSWKRRTFTLPFVASAVSSSSHFLPLGARSRSRKSKRSRTSAKRGLFFFSARRSGAGLLQIGITFLSDCTSGPPDEEGVLGIAMSWSQCFIRCSVLRKVAQRAA